MAPRKKSRLSGCPVRRKNVLPVLVWLRHANDINREVHATNGDTSRTWSHQCRGVSLLRAVSRTKRNRRQGALSGNSVDAASLLPGVRVFSPDHGVALGYAGFPRTPFHFDDAS